MIEQELCKDDQSLGSENDRRLVGLEICLEDILPAEARHLRQAECTRLHTRVEHEPGVELDAGALVLTSRRLKDLEDARCLESFALRFN